MVKKVPTVSIVTITQLKRFACLEILKDMIKSQTYKNICEWVLVEGSPSQDDAIQNAQNIQRLKESSDLKATIIYLEKVPGEKLGALRNKGNRICSGDITVVMDDDDYYPVERVEHAVKSLIHSNLQIAGCSDMYIYDYTIEKLCKFQKFGPNHSVNSCLAWKKKYLETHSHDDTKETGEEPSFTNNFKEPMIQLDSEKTIVQSSHTTNTYNKRELLTGGVIKINVSVSEISQPVTDFIKEPFFSRMKELFYKESKSKYDIVYFLGGFSPAKWDPSSKALNGSEQAVVHLTSEWTALGKKVAVYGTVTEGSYNGVDYVDWKKFPFNEIHETVILWRAYGIVCGSPFSIKAKNIWLDLHDGVPVKQLIEMWYRYGSKITKVFFKSQYHKESFERILRVTLSNNRVAIIPNGIRVKEFSQNKDQVQKNPYRFCYCSCYTRGLFPILQYVWPIIKKAEPRAELHIYYGMNLVQDEDFKKAMEQLLAKPGIMDHGRQPMDIIVREKYMSSFHLYLSNSDSEIDCISIKESLITGAIPLISNHGVFKEREGIHFDIADTNPMTFANIAIKIIELMKDTKIEALRQQLKKSPTIIPWEDIAIRWIAEE